MFDAVVTVFLRAVLTEAHVDVPANEAGRKVLVASNALDSASKGDPNDLRAAGRQALLPAPSMWN
jgi:hypothetical protein